MALSPIYKGISFPFRKGPTALPEPVIDDDLVKQSIIQILLTSRGERTMRPDFGSGIWRFVFENSESVLAELIRTEIMTTVGRFEPRAIIVGVDFSKSDSTLFVDIQFIVVATRKQQVVQISLPLPTTSP